MNESIANRVGRIVSGSLNALVDAVENAAPETVLKEAIREIDSAFNINIAATLWDQLALALKEIETTA